MATTALSRNSGTTNQEAANGFTDEIEIDFSDFSTDIIGTIADDTAHTLTVPIPAGAIMMNFGLELITPFQDSSGEGNASSLTLTVGDGADPDGFITSVQLHEDSTEITTIQWDTGALITAGANKVYNSADTIDFLFTPSVATSGSLSLNELTAGKLKIKWRMLRW